jgi:membrane-bound lytic murein transglycosylase B
MYGQDLNKDDFQNNLDISSDKIPAKYLKDIVNLGKSLSDMGIPSLWFKNNVESPDFKIYFNIGDYFGNMAEYRARKKKLDYETYKNNLGIDLKVAGGEKFIKKNFDLLNRIQMKNGIDLELISAIIGIETDFANTRQKGYFNIFDTLVSQYLVMDNRKQFAVTELYYLYKFSVKSGKASGYFVGSFAGASGWGQFIPSSLYNYFVDSNNMDSDMDIYALDDTLFSIENYLFKAGLNKDSISSRDKLYSAIYTYNRSDFYVRAVIYIYDKLKEKKIGPG